MKKIDFITVSLAAISLVCACQKSELVVDELNTVANNGSDDPAVIVCSTPDGVKTTYGDVVDDTYPVVWVRTDSLELFSSDGQTKAKYVNDLESGEKVANVPFHPYIGETPVCGEGRVAVYPNTRVRNFDGEKLTIDFSVLKKQTHHSTLANNSQNIAYFPMYAVEDAETAGKFVFNNLIGCIDFRLSDYQGLGLKIQSVKVTSASLGIVSNSGSVAIADGTITLPAASNGNNVLTINYATGFNIKTGNLASSKECYVIGLPAVKYPAGDLTFEFTDMEGRIYEQTLSKELTIQTGKVRKTPVLNFTLSYGTSNCYVVAPNGSVDIDITPKYTFSNRFDVTTLKDVKGTLPELTASVVWEQRPLVADGAVLDGEPVVDGNTLKVKVGSEKGNALVAIKNSDGVIVWSYHIWVTDTPSDLTYKIGSDLFDMMDRNLGATLAEPSVAGDARHMFGLLYQWGRKDPMAVYSTTSTKRAFNSVITSAAMTSSTNIAYGIQNPTVDIYKANGTWLPLGTVDVTQYAALWGAPEHFTTAEDIDLRSKFNKSTAAWDKKPYVKTVYDPCPEGYQVPEGYCFRGLCKTTLPARNSTYYTMEITYDGTNTTSYPLAGCISSNAATLSVGSLCTRGYYFTATPRLSDGLTYHVMQLVWSSNTSQLSSQQYLYQSNAASVRCVKSSTLYD